MDSGQVSFQFLNWSLLLSDVNLKSWAPLKCWTESWKAHLIGASRRLQIQLSSPHMFGSWQIVANSNLMRATFLGWGQPCKVDRGWVALPPAWKSCKSLGAPRRRRLRLELGRVGPCQGVHTESEGPLLVLAWEAKIHTAVPRYSDEGNYEDEVDSKLMIMGVRMAS